LGEGHGESVHLGAVLGPRWGECAGFRVGRIDFLRSTLAVAEQITRGQVWLPATRRADLEGLTFHDLRRANATALVLDGIDLKTAQTRLGHSDPRLTLAVYAQATSEADRAAADALGRRFLDARAMNAP
jgi:hypothetical protein